MEPRRLFAAPLVSVIPRKPSLYEAGPNTRLMDNLVQLACVIVGGGIGALIGLRYGFPWPTLGAIGGVLVAILLSGAVIGIIRFIRATR